MSVLEVASAVEPGTGRKDRTAPRITVGMPVYNGQRFVGQAIESVLTQTYGDFELLISDNASTDDTPRICRSYAEGDARIRYMSHERNLGAARNYNRLVHEARGQFFKWMPADDVLASPCLARCLEALDSERASVLSYPATVMIDDAGAHLDKDPQDRLDVRASAPHRRFREYVEWSFHNRGSNAVLGLIRTDILRRTALIGPYAGSDKVLLGELALYGSFARLSDPLFFRREHEGSSLQAHPEWGDRYRWFDPTIRGAHRMGNWRLLVEYVRAIARTPVGFQNSLRSFGHMMRYCSLYEPRLRQELRLVIYDAFPFLRR